MAAAVTPIKVDAQTDQLISHASHFLGCTKKEVVDTAVREYIENHRDAIEQGVVQALRQLDGSAASVVAMLADVSREDLERLGGTNIS